MTTYARRKHKTAAQLRRNPPPGAPGYKKPRAKPVDHEGQEQESLMLWLYGEHRRGTEVGALWPVTYHVPNGGQRNKVTAVAMKRQGVRAGVSDLDVMMARGGYYGLKLEFKATPPHHAPLADSQREWLALAESEGYCAVLAQGLEEARAVLREYAALAPTQAVGEPLHLESGTSWRK